MKLRPAGLSPELGLWVGISICSLSPLNAGVYLGTTTCKPQDIPQGANFCQQGTTVPSPGDGVTPFGVTHPPGYAGAGGSLVVNVCVSPEDSDLIPPTQRAVATWQSLTREVGQCLGCYLHEEGDPNPSSVPYHAESVVLHELGHCAVGLDHSDLQFDPPGDPERFERTSFTMSYDGVPEGIDAGIDEIRGSCDDVQESILGEIPESVHWFRRADNDPAIIDSTIIDTNSYSRSITQGLPQQCSWAANGNRAVNGQLGFSYTQNVMYSAIARGQKYLGLSSDDVNMVEMGMTGQDWLASTPSVSFSTRLFL